MDSALKKLTPRERYELIGRIIEEIQLRKHSYQAKKLTKYSYKNRLKVKKRTISKSIRHIQQLLGHLKFVNLL